ncbi:MAG: hypothetical protein KatS3mg111_2025 [Pirellulaceae bacterium]|nr:MAG: hypothetical protein KatS3mg111_2025 [Pirellulaceae bacterium]
MDRLLPDPLCVPDNPASAIARFHQPERASVRFPPICRAGRTGASALRLIAQRPLHRLPCVPHRAELVVGRDLLDDVAGAFVFFKRDAVPQIVDQPRRLEQSLDQNFQNVMSRIAVIFDRSPRREAVVVGGQGTDARGIAIADRQQLVVDEQRWNVLLVVLQLAIGLPQVGLLVGGILQFNDGNRQAVQKDNQIRPPCRVAAFDGELIDHQQVVVLRSSKIDQPCLVAACFARLGSILDIDSVGQQPVEPTVVLDQRRFRRPSDDANGLLDGIVRQVRIDLPQRRSQTRLKHDVFVTRPERIVCTGRDVGPAFHVVVECFEPSQSRPLDHCFRQRTVIGRDSRIWLASVIRNDSSCFSFQGDHGLSRIGWAVYLVLSIRSTN